MTVITEQLHTDMLSTADQLATMLDRDRAEALIILASVFDRAARSPWFGPDARVDLLSAACLATALATLEPRRRPRQDSARS